MAWLIYDGIILALLTVCILIYMKKGFISSLMGLLSFALSLVGAFFLSTPVTSAIYNWFVRDRLHSNIQSGKTGFFYNIVETVMKDGGTAVQTVDAAAMAIIQVVVFAALVILIYLVVRLLEKMFKDTNKVPIVGTLNKALGGVIGFVIGCLLCLVVVLVASILISASGNTLSWINTYIVEETKIFRLFYSFDLLSMLVV